MTKETDRILKFTVDYSLDENKFFNVELIVCGNKLLV